MIFSQITMNNTPPILDPDPLDSLSCLLWRNEESRRSKGHKDCGTGRKDDNHKKQTAAQKNSDGSYAAYQSFEKNR